MAKLLPANGADLEIRAHNGAEGFTADEIRGLLGSKLQLVLLDSLRTMVINPMSSPIGLQKNHKATALVSRALVARKSRVREEDVVYGDVLLAKYNELPMNEMHKEGVPLR